MSGNIDVTSGGITIGTKNAKYINIGNQSCSVNMSGIISATNVSFANVSVNNISVNSLNSLYTLKIEPNTDTNMIIAGTQSTGVLNIGNGTRTTTGTINIGTGSGVIANPINIGGVGSITTNNGNLTCTGLITANGGLRMGGSNNITLGNGTSAPTISQLGYNVASSLVSGSAISTGSTYVYSPSTGTSTYLLNPGVYIASLYGTISFANVTTTNITFQIGIATNSTTSPLSGNTNITYLDNTITYSPPNQNKSSYSGTLVFTASGTNYYYAYAYMSITSLTGTSVTPSIQMVNIIRIA